MEVERPRAQVRRAVHALPRRAGVARLVQPTFVARRLHHRVDRRRLAARDADVDLADERRRQAARQLRPRLAAVDRLVDAAFRRGTSGNDVPALPEAAVHAGIELVRVRVVDLDDTAAGLGVDEQRLLPRLAAVSGLVDAALGVRPERRAQRREPDDVGVGRVHDDAANLAGVLEAHELPGAAGVDGLVDAAADDHVAADRGAPGADPDDVRVGLGDVDRADRSGFDLAVGDRRPVGATGLRLPHTAAGRAHVVGAGLAAHAGNRGDASAPRRPDVPPAQILKRARLRAGGRRLHSGLRSGKRGPIRSGGKSTNRQNGISNAARRAERRCDMALSISCAFDGSHSLPAEAGSRRAVCVAKLPIGVASAFRRKAA